MTRPAPAPGDEDFDLINASKQQVTLQPGGCFFHHADSFAMLRGGHLDTRVLGTFQVSAGGDLANWHTGVPEAIPPVGSAIDLAIGSRRTLVMMDYLTKSGEAKLVPTCTYALTGLGCVSRLSRPTSKEMSLFCIPLAASSTSMRLRCDSTRSSRSVCTSNSIGLATGIAHLLGGWSMPAHVSL